ncbi:MAG: AAA-associated domain-containing protein [Candidatus Rifleibacteriota bacterium]
MLKEIVIWPSEEAKGNEKGKFFESLTNKIFSSQRYKVDSNVHYTGMEFDLECKHLDRTDERCLVECKAKKSLSSDEITKFVFNKEYKKFSIGFFLYTGNFERQVAGLISEIQSDGRYKNLYFWNAEKVMELLVASSTISNYDYEFTGLDINKLILLYSHLGVFYIPIMSSGTIPESFSILDAKCNSIIKEASVIDSIKNYIEELRPLGYKDDPCKRTNIEDQRDQTKKEIETIAEIQSSASWDDYKPASLKYFVGRKRQKDFLFGVLDEIRKGNSNKRVFYIDGKSGWGKSSLINDLKERCRNMHYKNKYFCLAVDSRSANSHNFIPLAFKMILKKAVEDKFIPSQFLSVKIPSTFDILADPNTMLLQEWLKKNSRYLIIVFDQFEDVFRKESIFKSFYKFLVDIYNLEGNFILGFSWKSEVNIPIENEAYHLWQQAKEFAISVSLDEFFVSESKSIIKQLEKDVKEKFNLDIVRKVVDNSQGYPWLVKKLCIHIKKQIKQGLDIESLYEQDFQVERLFEDDLEELTPEEVKGLRYIANRAFNDQAFDVTELDDTISSEIVQHLINKRLIIKSGTKYNIYWDIFRDYLVTNEIPPIGETYLIRQQVNSVYEAFLTFSNSECLSLEQFVEKIPNAVAEGAALNLLRELRSLGLINYKNNLYYLKSSIRNVSEKSFKDYIKEKLTKHSFTIALKKISNREISLLDLIRIIKSKIKTKTYSDRTLETYAQIFFGWIDFLDLGNLNVNPAVLSSAKNAFSYTPQMYPIEVEAFILSFGKIDLENPTKKVNKLIYDAKSLGLLSYSKNRIQLSDLGQKAVNGTELERKSIFAEQAQKTEKIRFAHDVLRNHSGISSRTFKSLIAQILDGLNSQVYINKTSRALFLWASYIVDVEGKIGKKFS